MQWNEAIFMRKLWVCAVRFTERKWYALYMGRLVFSVEHTHTRTHYVLFSDIHYHKCVHVHIHVVLIVRFLLQIFANFIIELNVFGGEIKNTLLFVVNGRAIYVPFFIIFIECFVYVACLPSITSKILMLFFIEMMISRSVHALCCHSSSFLVYL